MNTLFTSYEKSKDFLICVDSDGCAMDTMDLKHFKAFGPELIPIFNLHDHEDRLLFLWNDLNLYQKTRGINRFKGLLQILDMANEKGWINQDLSSLRTWVENTRELSKPSLEKEIEKNPSPMLKKALTWSINVNKKIAKISQQGVPFSGVKEALKNMEQFADIAVVSSANGEALEDEWNEHGLFQYTKALLGQEAGTKAQCIKALLSLGYPPQNSLMVGDSPGDLEAALENNIGFFPILVGKESKSWQELEKIALPKLIHGTFHGAYQEELIHSFKHILHMDH